MPAAHGEPAVPGGAPVVIRGPRLVLRPLTAAEIDEEWQAMATADPMETPGQPDEAKFRARLRDSGRLVNGRLDLAVDAGGVSIGRIQTFVPPARPLPPGTFEIGIGLRPAARGRGYGREALTLLTGWLFSHAGAEVVRAETDPANAAMRTVFERCGWQPAGRLTELGREWLVYLITRAQWRAQSGSR